MRLPVFLCSCLITLPLSAEVPDVAADIAPVHSLVSRVMDGVGTPELIVRPDASPHGYSMRPSEASALQEAEVVFWVGPELTPWLEGAIDSLASDAVSIPLLDSEDTIKLPFRTTAIFDAHDHEGHEDHEDHKDGHEDHDHEHGHDDHHEGEHGEHHEDKHADHHDEHEGHDEHHDDHGHDDHGHDHSGVDPHAWLDPVNAKLWLAVIAEQLSELDPENAGTYRNNAAAGGAELDSLISELDAKFAEISPPKFVVFHDAYHYFEDRFGLETVGAISMGDAAKPGIARIQEIQEAIAEHSVACALSEPQFNTALIATAFEGTDAKVIEIDPLGVKLSKGSQLYPELLRNMAESVLQCAE